MRGGPQLPLRLRLQGGSLLLVSTFLASLRRTCKACLGIRWTTRPHRSMRVKSKRTSSRTSRRASRARRRLVAGTSEFPICVGSRLTGRNQFTQLHSSLPKLRDEIKASILDGTFTPAKVAVLNSEELATAEQLAEIEAARAESLRQTVRQDDEYVAVRIGRDGFEEAVDRRQAEQEAQRKQEDAEKKRHDDDDEAPQTPKDVEARRESIATASPKTTVESPKSPVRRLSTAQPHSPITPHRPSVEFASAWGSGAKVSDADFDAADQDQDAIDLSDIAAAEVSYDDGLDGAYESDPMGDFLARPVVWSGGVRPSISYMLTSDHEPGRGFTAHPTHPDPGRSRPNDSSRWILQAPPAATHDRDCRPRPQRQ